MFIIEIEYRLISFLIFIHRNRICKTGQDYKETTKLVKGDDSSPDIPVEALSPDIPEEITNVSETNSEITTVAPTDKPNNQTEVI